MNSFAPPPDLPAATTLDEVIARIDAVVEWSITSSSRLGYFAALYKRITIAVRTAIAQGVFADGPRMERFDVAFANRYLDALNGHLHPQRYPRPTRSWAVAFGEASAGDPILVQHLVAGVTAHIALDLGIAAVQVSPGPALWTLREDFTAINAVLAAQVSDVVGRLNQLSPALGELYALLGSGELFAINAAVRAMRDSAWRFASLLAQEPVIAHGPTIWVRDRWVARQVVSVFEAAALSPVSQAVIREIAERESRNIAGNIRGLDAIAATPATPIRIAL
ncbi:DUF5995 family protein [Mycobacterium sp. UM_Kg1]|uniref:DUF5995 family protein n=1 Tax=Mycobacterium sp. UM_Kg1 TaxID=1545691 RepID=UPI00061A973D|nr:DUF5995 family protein [Mycobacterium sp. UM_Kg1]